MAAELLQVRLPPPWNYGVTSDGRVFFINEDEQTTTWLHPERNHPVQSGRILDTELPRGWERDFTAERIPYYIDHVNGRTTFAHPISGAVHPAVMSEPPNSELEKSQREKSLEATRKQNNQKKTKQKPIDQGPVVKRNLSSPVTLQGYLYKQESGPLKPWKKKWTVLSDFILFYYKGTEENSLQGSILLPGYKISQCTKKDAGSKKWAFKLEHQNMKPVLFAADTEEDFTTWFDTVSLATQLQKNTVLEQNNNEPEDTGGFAPVQKVQPQLQQPPSPTDRPRSSSQGSERRSQGSERRSQGSDQRSRSQGSDQRSRSASDPDRQDPRDSYVDPNYEDPRAMDRTLMDPRTQGRDPRYQDPRASYSGSQKYLSDPRYADPRRNDSRRSEATNPDQSYQQQDPRYQQSRQRDSIQSDTKRVADPRYQQDPRQRDSIQSDARSNDPRYQDPRLRDSIRSDQRRPDSRHPPDPRYNNDPPRQQRPQNDPRNVDPRYQQRESVQSDPRYQDARREPQNQSIRSQDPRQQQDPRQNRSDPRYQASMDLSRNSMSGDPRGGSRRPPDNVQRPASDPRDSLRRPPPDARDQRPRDPRYEDQTDSFRQAPQGQGQRSTEVRDSPRSQSTEPLRTSKSDVQMRGNKSAYPPNHRHSQGSSLGSSQNSSNKYAERPVDVRDPYYDLRNPRFQGLVPDPVSPVGQKVVVDSPRGSETSKSDSMRRLQEWTKQQQSSSSPRPQQQQQQQEKTATSPPNKYFEPLTIDTSPPHRRSHLQLPPNQSGPRSSSPSPGRPPLPPEYRAQYAAQLAEAATPQTRRDLLTAAEVEAKRRQGEPMYFRYPEVSPGAEKESETKNESGDRERTEDKADGQDEDEMRRGYSGDEGMLAAARREAEEAEKLAQQQQRESQRSSRYDPERSSIRSGQSFQQQQPPATTPSQYSGRLPGAPYGPATNIRDPSNQNQDPRNQRRDPSNQNQDPRNQKRDPSSQPRDASNQRRDPSNQTRDASNQRRDLSNQSRNQQDLSNQYKSPSNQSRDLINQSRDLSNQQKGTRDSLNYPSGYVERYPPVEPNRQPRSPEERTPPRREQHYDTPKPRKQRQNEDDNDDDNSGVRTAAEEMKRMRRKSGDYSRELEQKEKSRLNKHIANSFKRLSLGNELGQQLTDDEELSPSKTGYDWSKPVRHSLDWEAEKSIFRKDADEEQFWKSIELKSPEVQSPQDMYEDIVKAYSTGKAKGAKTTEPRYQTSKVPAFKTSLEEMRQQQSTLDRTYQQQHQQQHQQQQEQQSTVDRAYGQQQQQQQQQPQEYQYQQQQQPQQQQQQSTLDRAYEQQQQQQQQQEYQYQQQETKTKVESPRQNISYQTSDDSPRYPTNSDSLKYYADYQDPKADVNENMLFGLNKEWKSPQSPKNPAVTEFKMADAGGESGEYKVTETANVSIFDRKVDDSDLYEPYEVKAPKQPASEANFPKSASIDSNLALADQDRSFEVVGDVDPFGNMNQSSGSNILLNQAPRPFDPLYSSMKKPKGWRSVNLGKNAAASRKSWSAPNNSRTLDTPWDQSASRKSWSNPRENTAVEESTLDEKFKQVENPTYDMHQDKASDPQQKPLHELYEDISANQIARDNPIYMYEEKPTNQVPREIDYDRYQKSTNQVSPQGNEIYEDVLTDQMPAKRSTSEMSPSYGMYEDVDTSDIYQDRPSRSMYEDIATTQMHRNKPDNEYPVAGANQKPQDKPTNQVSEFESTNEMYQDIYQRPQEISTNQRPQDKPTNQVSRFEPSDEIYQSYERPQEISANQRPREKPTNQVSQFEPRDVMYESYERPQEISTNQRPRDKPSNQKPWNNTGSRHSWSQQGSRSKPRSDYQEYDQQRQNPSDRRSIASDINPYAAVSRQLSTLSNAEQQPMARTSRHPRSDYQDYNQQRQNPSDRRSTASDINPYATVSRQLSTLSNAEQQPMARTSNPRSDYQDYNQQRQNPADRRSTASDINPYAAVSRQLSTLSNAEQQQQPMPRTSHYDTLPVRHRSKRPNSSASSRPRSYHDASLSPSDVNTDYIEMSSVSVEKINKLEMENRISRSFTEDEGQGHEEGQAESWQQPQQQQQQPQSSRPAGSPRPQPRAVQPQYSIAAIKEDPDMADDEVLASRNLTKLQQCLTGHRLRLSIAATDLIGKSHEELVLLLIQLRRSQSRLDNQRTAYQQKLQQDRGREKQYNTLRSTSAGRLEESIEEEHEQYQSLKGHSNKLNTQFEVHKPLVNLVDNLVTMGSLYGGDNLMLASQYKRHKLPPGQYQPPKEMIEWSRQHQEEVLVKEQEQELIKLSEDESELEAKLQELYALDRQLQQRSLTVTSLQQDREMLEKGLSHAKNEEAAAKYEPNELQRASQRRRNIEAELSKVRQQLADSSRDLEETATENAKVEQEVILLRKKIYGHNKSQTSPGIAGQDGGSRARVQLERELDQVAGLLSSLSNQGEQLAKVMDAFREPADSSASSNNFVQDRVRFESSLASQPQPGLRNGATITETRTDTTHSYSAQPFRSSFGSGGGGTGTGKPTSAVPPQTRQPPAQDLAPRDLSQEDDKMKRYYGLIPKEKPKNQTVRDVKKQASERRGRETSRRGEDEYVEAKKRSQSLPRRSAPPMLDTSSQRAKDDISMERRTVQKESSSTLSASARLFPQQQSTKDPVRRLSDIVTPRPFPSSQSQTSLQMSSQSKSSFQNGQSKSTFASSQSQPSFQNGPSKSSFQNRSSTVATVHPVIKATPLKSSPSSSAPFGSYKPAGPMSEEAKEKLRARRQPRSRFMTISSSQPAKMETPTGKKEQRMHSVAGDLIAGRGVHDVPYLTKSQSAREIHFDETTIDQEVLFVPDKVDIPERYVPDSDDDEGQLSPADRQARREKAEKIRRLLARQSLQEWREDELGTGSKFDAYSQEPGNIHRELQRETQRREHVLNMRHALAQEVTAKSKQVAAHHQQRSSSSTTPTGFYT